MGEAGETDAFAEFQDEYGYLATEIYEDLKKTSHLLDIADQTHASGMSPIWVFYWCYRTNM